MFWLATRQTILSLRLKLMSQTSTIFKKHSQTKALSPGYQLAKFQHLFKNYQNVDKLNNITGKIFVTCLVTQPHNQSMFQHQKHKVLIMLYLILMV